MFRREMSLVGLDDTARGRLDRFAAAFDRVNAHEYVQYAVVPASPKDIAAAEADALEIIGSGPQHDAIRGAVAAFIDAAGIAYASHLALPQYLLLNDAVADRPADRQRFLQSLERAVVAVILWDALPETDRDTLAGPWGPLVDDAVGAE